MENYEDTSALLDLISSRTDELYEDAPCGFLFTLPDGTILKANKTLLNWLGYPSNEFLIRKRFQDILTVGCKIYYETHYAPLLRIQGHLSEVTLDLRGKEGLQIPVLINSSEMKDASGNVILIRSTVFNITDRRKYERELLNARNRAEQSERRLRFLAKAGDMFRNTPNPEQSIKALAHLATESFSDACAIDFFENSGVKRVASSSRFNHKNLPEINSIEDFKMRNTPVLILDTNHSSQENGDSLNKYLKDPDTNFNVQSLLMVPIRSGHDCDGDAKGVLTFYMLELGRHFTGEDQELVMELSDRCCLLVETYALQVEKNRAIEALRENHEWLSTTLKSIGDAVIAINKDKTISFMNTIAENLTGWPSNDAKGKPVEDVFQIINSLTGEPAFNPVEKVLSEGKIVGLANNTALICKDGTQRIIEDSAAPIKDANGEVHGVVLVFRDVTEKYAEEQEKNTALENLKEEREVREKFVATLTHDLRSPITAIKMSAQLILRKTDNPSAVQTQAVRVINSVNRVDQMIQDLLDANQIRAGEKIPLELSLFDLAKEIKEVLVDLATIHGNRFEYVGESALEGHWSATGLKRVLENLCNNAIKYGLPHGKVQVFLKKAGDKAILSVHNQGTPIDPEDQKTLFEPYKRTSSAQQSGQKGWGLGLTLVRGVAEAHGGSVSVESNVLHGTTFTVLLPVDTRADSEVMK